MAGFGEVIHGHYGQYITKQYGTASETEVKEFFLKNMETGEQGPCNYTVFFGTQKLSEYLWAGFASSVGAQGSKAGYQHVVYQKRTLSGMHDGEMLLQFPFMSARQCMEYLGNQKEFTRETRRPLIESLNADRQQADVEISVDRKLLGDIACYCVGKTRTNSGEFLKILVPPGTENYQGYCLAVIRMILRAIPCGLRTNLSFATNAPDMKYKFFGILFKRDEGEQGSGYVRANGDFDQTFLRDIYLEEPLEKIIRACALDDTLAEACYRDMERVLDAQGKLDAGCYGDYYTLYKLQEEPFCLDYLRELNRMFVSVEREWKRKQVENVLLERAPDVRIAEETIEKSGAYKNARELKEVVEILESIDGILAYYRGKGGNLSNEFMNGMLEKVLCCSSEKDIQRFFILIKKIKPEALTEAKHYALQSVSRFFDGYRKTGTDPEKYPELFACLCGIREAVLKMIPDAEQRWPQDYMFFNGKFESCFNKCLLRFANLDFTPDRLREVLEFSKKLLNRRQFYRDLSAEIKKNYQEGRIRREEVIQIYQDMEEAAGGQKALRFRDDTERMEADEKEDWEEDKKEKYSGEYCKESYSSENEDRKRAEREKIRRRQEVKRRLMLFSAACAAVVVVGVAAAVVLSRKDKDPEMVRLPVNETENEENSGNGDGVEPPAGKMSKAMADSILEEAAELWISEESYAQAVTEFKSVDVQDIVDYMKQQESDGHQAQAVREYLAFSVMEDINKETPDKDYEIVNVDFYDVSGFQDMKPLARECPAVLILTVKNESGNRNKIYYYNKKENGFVDYGRNPNGMKTDEAELREKIKADIEPIITTRTAHVRDAMAVSVFQKTQK